MDIRVKIRQLVRPTKTVRCMLCENTATKEALFDSEHGVLVARRYCDKCIQQASLT